MEIPGLFPHFHVCESDCGATVLHSAKASTEMLGALRTSVFAHILRGSFIPSSETELDLSALQSNQGLRSHEYPGRDGDFGTTQIPAPASLPARQLRYHTLGAE